MRKPSVIRVPRNAPLVHVVRDGVVEGIHYGSIVVLAADGSIEFAAGDIHAACCPRSALKPVQAVGMSRVGLSLTGELLVLAAASHSGEDRQIVGVRRILDLAALDEAALRNPVDLPTDPDTRVRWLTIGMRPNRLAQACSGKHAAMLLTCRRHGWPVDSYLDPAHPLQQALAATVSDLAGEQIAQVAVDGCGAPLFAISLLGLTRAVARIATATQDSHARQVAAAFREYPEMVAGVHRDTTKLMRVVPGLISKDGAEGVQVSALPDGRAVGVKVSDGGERALAPLTAAALARCGVDPAVLVPFASRPLFGGGMVVGRLAVVGQLGEAIEPLASMRIAELAAATRP
jgi:L-asparaginase II